VSPTDFIQVGREALYTILLVGAPVMLVALGVGLAIALFQALTQMQEITLAFVPKILLIFVSLIFLLPYMMTTLVTFTEGLFDRIITLGA
jgi:flagellar biosynthetic protein FliQ